MPIKGLTDEHVQLSKAFPTIARLRKGAPKNAKGHVGKDLDYFRVTFEPGYEALEETFVQLYGDKPKFFDDVRVLGNSVHDVFDSWLEEWTATIMQRRCDGQYQVVRWHGGIYETAEMLGGMVPMCRRSSQYPAEPGEPMCNCTRVGRLNLWLPALVRETGIQGTVLVTTGSFNDITTIFNTLSSLEQMYGTLYKIPLMLGRVPKEISAPKKEKNGEVSGRINVTKSLFIFEAQPDWQKQQMAALEEVEFHRLQIGAPQLPEGSATPPFELPPGYGPPDADDTLTDDREYVEAPAGLTPADQAVVEQAIAIRVEEHQGRRVLFFVCDSGFEARAYSREVFENVDEIKELGEDFFTPGNGISLNPYMTVRAEPHVRKRDRNKPDADPYWLVTYAAPPTGKKFEMVVTYTAEAEGEADF